MNSEVSAKPSSGTKSLTEKILASLNSDTKYIFYEGVSYKACENTRFISKNDFEFKQVKGTYFTLEDAFILNGIHALGYATVEALHMYLAVERRKFPKKAIPDLTKEKLHSRMVFLTKQGILAEYDYITQKKIVVRVFVCPAYGHLYFRNLLDSYSSYDQSALFRSETEIFKRLATNDITLSFAQYKYLKKLEVNWRSVEDSNKGLGYIYGFVEMEKEDEKLNFLIEPIYFSIDSRIMTEEENIEKINNRLDKVTEIVEKFKGDINTKVVFCVENMEGLKKFVNLIRSRDLELFNDALYVSENVVSRNNKNLDQSFLSIDFNSEKPKLQPFVNFWAFEN